MKIQDAPVILFVVLLAALVGCTPKRDPRAEFRTEFRSRLEKVEAALGQYRSGSHGTEMTAQSTGKAVTIDLPNSTLVASAAEAVGEQLGLVKFGVINQPLSGFDAWAAKLKQDHAEFRGRISSRLDELRAAYERNPGAFDYGGPSILGDGPAVALQNGDLVFRGMSGWVSVRETVVNLDLDPWIRRVRQMSEQAARNASRGAGPGTAEPKSR